MHFVLKLLHAIGEAAILLDASLKSDLTKSVGGQARANYLNPQFCASYLNPQFCARDWSSYLETRSDVFEIPPS